MRALLLTRYASRQRRQRAARQKQAACSALDTTQTLVAGGARGKEPPGQPLIPRMPCGQRVCETRRLAQKTLAELRR